MNVFDLAAVLTLDSSQYDKSLAEAKGNATTFGKGLANVGKVVATGVAAGGAAIAALSTAAVKSYANYEQLAGGVKKLYQNASDEVMKYAQNAYATSGMSANQYMEQATSFSAALVNSLNGDFSAAAKQTDVAMRAISDNFNTFGGDISMIQGAFQGFAKQNYTMLDNLKLGYGGTKSEMSRLIDDANEYAQTIGMAGDLSIDSFSDIVTAIDLVQQKQHIAGTTAKEAGTTIEGSINMAKAAWENLLTGFADSDADIGKLAGNFVDSVVTAAGNVVPRFIEALGGIAEGVPEIAIRLKDAFIAQAGSLAEAGMEMLNGIMKGLTGNVSAFIEMALPMIANFSESLRSNAGKLVDVGINMIMKIAQGIVNAMPTIIEQLPTIITNIAGIINDNAPKLIMAGFQLIVMLAKGIVDNIPVIIENLPQIFTAIVAAFTALNWAAVGKIAVKGIANGIKALGKGIVSAAKSIAKSGIKAFTQGFSNARSVGANVVRALAQAIAKGLGAVRTAAIKVAKGAINAIKGAFSNVAEIGMNLVRGIWSGISGGLGWIKSQISGWVGNVKNFLKSLFGIHSPSTWARDVIGMNIVRGLAEGLEDGTGMIDSAMTDLVSVPDFGFGSAESSMTDNFKQVSITNNITVDGAENPEEFANRLVRQLQIDMRTA